MLRAVANKRRGSWDFIKEAQTLCLFIWSEKDWLFVFKEEGRFMMC